MKKLKISSVHYHHKGYSPCRGMYVLKNEKLLDVILVKKGDLQAGGTYGHFTNMDLARVFLVPVNLFSNPVQINLVNF